MPAKNIIFANGMKITMSTPVRARAAVRRALDGESARRGCLMCSSLAYMLLKLIRCRTENHLFDTGANMAKPDKQKSANSLRTEHADHCKRSDVRCASTAMHLVPVRGEILA